MVALVLGSLGIAWAGVLVRLADVPVATSATYRCLYAVPAFLAIGYVVRRRATGRARELVGPLDGHGHRLAALAGAGLAGRLLFWHAAIAAVGAGLAAVIVDLQVAFVPLFAWLVLGQRLHRRHVVALPIVVTGCVLVSGILGEGEAGSHPVRGVVLGVCGALMYALYQLALASSVRHGGAPVTALTTASAVSAVITGGWGVATQSLDAPSWPAHGWLVLLALGVQVAAWCLVAWAMLRVRSTTVSLVLVLHPVGTLLLGVVLLDERPLALQWIGAVVILAGIALAAATEPPEPTDDVSGERRSSGALLPP